MLKYLISIVFLLASSEAFSANWYVRPSTGGVYGSDNGTSYANAWNSLSDVVWGVSGVNTGDTLYVCGSFPVADKDASKGGVAMLSVEQTGSTINGDCSANGDLSQAILDGEGTATYGMYCDTAAECQDQVWRNIKVKNLTTRGHYIRNGTTYADSVNFTGYNLDCTGVTSGSANGQWCVAGYGQNATFSELDLSATKDDSLHWEGSFLTVQDSRFYLPGTGGTNIGDCVQVITETDGAIIRRNYCDKRAVTGDGNMSKSCWVIGDPATGTSGEISDNECYLPTTGNSTYESKPILVSTSVTGVRILRNYIKGGYYGIFAFGGGATIVGNIVEDTELQGIVVPTTTTTGTTLVANNTVNGSSICYILKGASGAVTVNAYNNLALNCSSYGYEKITATYNQSNNRCGGVIGTACSNNAGTISTETSPTLLVGGTDPNTIAGYRLSATSTLRRAGVSLNLGNFQDYENRTFLFPPSIGALEAASGDVITNNTRTTASTRTNRN